MKVTDTKRGFHLRIDSLEEFGALVALIRGEEDLSQLPERTAALRKSTAALAAAAAAGNAPPTTRPQEG